MADTKQNAAHGSSEGVAITPQALPSRIQYPFPPNGEPRNAADEIANAIWKEGK